jgi:hypothetical protein
MKWSLCSGSTWRILCWLETGLQGHVACGIHASRRGLRCTIHGVTVARGINPDALVRDFDAYVAKRRKSKSYPGQ